jgi:NADH pyrophosphatase NudC (nudix superfamily)
MTDLSLEHALLREIKEEVGIDIEQIHVGLE